MCWFNPYCLKSPWYWNPVRVELVFLFVRLISFHFVQIFYRKLAVISLKTLKNKQICFLVRPYCYCKVTSVVSDSVWPHRRQPTRLPRPWDSPGKKTGVGCHFLLQCMKVKSEREVAQSCLTPSNPMDHSLLGSSVHVIFQARVLEWGAIAFSSLSLLLIKIMECIYFLAYYFQNHMWFFLITMEHIYKGEKPSFQKINHFYFSKVLILLQRI